MLQELISQEIQSALDALLQDRPGGTVIRLRLQAVLEQTTQRIARYSRNDTLLNLKTSADVAELYGCSKQAINTRANRLKTRLGDFGWQIGPGMWVFTPEEVERLMPGPSGRPKSGDIEVALTRTL